MSLARPSARIAREGEDVVPADRSVRPAQRLGHRSWHRDDQRRLDEARKRSWDEIRLVAADAVDAKDFDPARARGRPDVRLWTVGRLVPTARERFLRLARRLSDDLYRD